MQNHRLKKTALALFAALAIILGAWGCAAPASDGTVLRLPGGSDWGAPSPYLHSSRGPGTAKMKLAFASLLEKDENGMVPWLAQSWSVSGNTYTFTLFEGATFHDGSPVTADDVAFSIDYQKAHPPVIAYLGAKDKFIISSYEVEDSRTIAITVDRPIATTLADLGSFIILPKHVWQSVDDPSSYDGEGVYVGAGAYRVTGYDGGTGAYEFTAFNEFKGGTPAVDKIQFVPVSDEVLSFNSGDIDIAALPADLKAGFESKEGVGVVTKDNDFGYKLLINFDKRPEFKDISYRRALYAALDRQGVVDKVFRGAGDVGSAGYAPPGSVYYNENVAVYPYDPDAAREFFSGKGMAVSIIAANSGDDVDIAELIKLDLEAAGIEASVAAYDSAVRDDMVNSGDYQLALVGNGGWGGRAPDYLRTVFADGYKNKGGNPHEMGPIGYSNEKINALCEAEYRETDFNKRIGLFKELQLEISREIPLIVVATKSSYSMYDSVKYGGWMKTFDYQQVEQNRLSYMKRGA